MRLVRVQRRRIFDLRTSLIGLQKILLDPLALFALDLARHVLICYFIYNNVKLFDINRVTQQPDFDPFLVFFPEFTEKIVF